MTCAAPSIPYPSTGATSLDDETLCRAVLTYCINSADAIMSTMLRGAPDARSIVDLLIRELSSPSDRASATASLTTRSAQGKLDDIFARGLIGTGRRLHPRHLKAFHNAMHHWLTRLSQLPSFDDETLTGIVTGSGRYWIIAPHNPCWPSRLDDITLDGQWAPPLCLWGSGDRGALSSCSGPVSVVGSRGANDYGRNIARNIARDAASRGHTVVSGGALGADAAAHWGALDAMESYGEHDAGRTVAVFAGGLDHIGPRRNAQLFDAILAHHGALISELCPDTIPEPRRFLLRNRIIAALSRSVVVAQARLRSGALNTAHWANEFSRDVYAIPGNVDTPGNAGCNRLIETNQAMILCTDHPGEDICHPGHTPGPAPTSAAVQPPDGNGPCLPRTGQPADDPRDSDDLDRNGATNRGFGGIERSHLPMARGVLSYLRRRNTAGIDQLMEKMRGTRPPGPGDDAREKPESRAAPPQEEAHDDATIHRNDPRQLITTLGEMEMAGLIVIHGSSVSMPRPSATAHATTPHTPDTR